VGRRITPESSPARGPLSVTRHDPERTSRELGPLGDADQSKTLAALRRVAAFEPVPIVCDRDFDVVVLAHELNVRPGCTGMRDDVAQRLLRNSVDAEGRLRADRPEVALGVAAHRQAVSALELTTIRGQAFRQAEMLEDGRMEIV